MTFANPTPLRLGMRGNYSGQRWVVAGRVVLSVEVDGEEYFWNEFNLESDAGAAATLVYEETERGAEWRWFQLFEPEYPPTAGDAAAKRVGDPVNFDGLDLEVSLVDESRVRRIEGRAPAGVEVGDRAGYFNAEAGDTMYVVSWTGDEVECYRGRTISRGAVASAFGLRTSEFQVGSAQMAAWDSGGSFWESSGLQKNAGVLLTLLVFGAAFFWRACDGGSLRGSQRPPALVSHALPPSPLPAGGEFLLGGERYFVDTHAVVRVEETRVNFLRHEYSLRDAGGNPALLVFPVRAGGREAVLFQPLAAVGALTPFQAAEVVAGREVNIAGVGARVDQIFCANVLQQEGGAGNSPFWRQTRYGFCGQGREGILLARWSSGGAVEFYRGKPVELANSPMAAR